LEFDEPWAAAADQENETYNQIGEPYGLTLELTNGTFSGQTAESHCPTGDSCGPTLVPCYGSTN
ncbi:unnamed protein product, partial [Symbiodinium sp. KB8]